MVSRVRDAEDLAMEDARRSTKESIPSSEASLSESLETDEEEHETNRLIEVA